MTSAGIVTSIGRGVTNIASRAGYSIPAPGIQQILQASGSSADMFLAKDNNWFDTALNMAGIASIFYAPLLLPVAIGYGIKSLTYLAGALKSLFSLDFGGVLKNLGAAAMTGICALPIFGGGFKALKSAWTTALEKAGGKFTGQFAQNFADDLVGMFAGKNEQLLTGYRAGVDAFKDAGKDVNFFGKLWNSIKEYFFVASKGIKRTEKGGIIANFLDGFNNKAPLATELAKAA